MKFKLIICGLLFSSSVLAISSGEVPGAGSDELSATEQADVSKNIESTIDKDKAAVEVQIPMLTVKEVESYAEIGTNVAKAISSAARELGAVENDYLTTPVGIITTGLIVYKVLGHDAIKEIHSFVEGVLFVFVMFIYGIWFLRRSVETEITYSKDKTNIFGNPRVERIDRQKLSGEQQLFFTVGILVCAIIAILIM